MNAEAWVASLRGRARFHLEVIMSQSFSNAGDAGGVSAGHKLISAVEELLDSPERLQARAREAMARAGGDAGRACEAIIREQSNASALAGGLATMPGLVPGIGSVMAAYGGIVVQMVYVLKTETEMCLMMQSALGYDIRDPRERQLGLLLACVGTFESREGGDPLVRLGVTSLEAIWNYTPRELGKLLVNVAGRMVVYSAAKQSLRAVVFAAPLIGIGVGAGVNKVMTRRVGRRALGALLKRRG